MGADPILYVLRWYPTLSETFVYREIRELQARGQPVIVWSLGAREDGAANPELPDVEVWRHAICGRARLRGVCRVHAHFEGEASIAARRLAQRLGVPFSVTVHAVGLFRPRAGIVARLRAARPVVTVCAHHQRWLAERYGVEAVVVRCGVDLPDATADPGREPAGVVAVARDVPKKDLERLRLACPQAQVLSHHTGAQVRAALETAQLFALPVRVGPRGARDGVPVAMMEAMARGLPVVTRPVAGVPELVDASVGWVGEDFEGHLRAALSDPGARRVRGRAARDRIRAGWTIQASVDGLLAAWDRLTP